jgi:copper chaperone CopZ
MPVGERCSGRLSAGLRKLDGVLDAQADHVKKEAVVRYDPARVTPERIKQEIEKLGFEAQ